MSTVSGSIFVGKHNVGISVNRPRRLLVTAFMRVSNWVVIKHFHSHKQINLEMLSFCQFVTANIVKIPLNTSPMSINIAKTMLYSQFLATKEIQLIRIPTIFSIETSKEGW